MVLNKKIILNSFLFIIGIIFTAFFFVTLKVHSDNLQLIDKVYKVLNEGIWIHHGNAGTGVGFVPGSFLTVITTLPMMIYNSPYSAMAVIGLFHVLAFFFLWDSVKNLSSFVMLDLILLFWLNPWRVEQAELYNPGYLFFFSAIHLWTSLKMNKSSFWLSFLHVLNIGFCGQVHYSVLILIILSLLLYYYRKIKVNWWGAAFGGIVTLLSLVPYFIEYFHSPELKVTLVKSNEVFIGRNLVLIYPVLKSALYWVRYGSTYFARHIFSEINFQWLAFYPFLQSGLEYLFKAFMFSFAVVTTLISFKFNLRFFKKGRKLLTFRRPVELQIQNISLRSQLYSYGFLMSVSMLLASALSPVEFNHWHLILCFPVVTILISMQFQLIKKLISEKKQAFVYSIIIIYFCIHNLFVGMGSRSHNIENNYAIDLKTVRP